MPPRFVADDWRLQLVDQLQHLLGGFYLQPRQCLVGVHAHVRQSGGRSRCMAYDARHIQVNLNPAALVGGGSPRLGTLVGL
eukprot:COSAG01_NODE_153_length_23909_cov_32.542018_29_plen_81_part_00